MLKILITTIIFAIFFGISLLLTFWPQKIQAHDLKTIGDPDKVSERVPRALKPLAKKLKQIEYESRAGEEYLTILRLIGGLALVIMIIALVLVLRKHF